ncbi:hypothetical protein [Paenibacillus pini]|uniref:DUF4340 domain-containing protein n=1 Tax=Paenibacillus pini JCM 16418 TaxID=1236976 RepID=W7YJL9_9BACL|nr:hypothetical protein [Paenibacillus pini]GAF08697.1 hypothetical protein JCM16418_2786 [Paenibacillus pini JCM 16418]
MMKKYIPIGLIAIVLIVGAVYVFNQDRTADTSPESGQGQEVTVDPNVTGENNPPNKASEPFSWRDDQVKELEWEGKNGSWVLKKKAEANTVAWTLNGEEASAEDASQLIKQVRALPEKDRTKEAAELEQGISEFTLTLTLSDDKQLVYQGVSTSDQPEIFWLLPALKEGLAYPLKADDVKKLELGVSNIMNTSQ